MISRNIAERFAHCGVGDSFRRDGSPGMSSGFSMRKTAYESEIWVDADEAGTSFNRDFYGSVLIHPLDSAAAELLEQRILTKNC